MSTNKLVKKLNSRRLLKEDLDIPCKNLAIFLLGKILVRQFDNQTILKGRIVETEAYLGGDDKGSHSYNGRQEFYIFNIIHSEFQNIFYKDVQQQMNQCFYQQELAMYT